MTEAPDKTSPAAATIRNRDIVYQSNASRARRDIPFRSGVCVQPDPTWSSAQRSGVGGLAKRPQSEIDAYCDRGASMTLAAGLPAADAHHVLQKLQTIALSGRVKTQWSYGRMALLFLLGLGGIAPAAALFSAGLAHLALSSFVLDGIVGIGAFGFASAGTIFTWWLHRRSIRAAKASWDHARQWFEHQPQAQQSCCSRIFSIRIHLSNSELPEIAQKDIRSALNTLETHLVNNPNTAQGMESTLLQIEEQLAHNSVSETMTAEVLGSLERAVSLGRSALSQTEHRQIPPRAPRPT